MRVKLLVKLSNCLNLNYVDLKLTKLYFKRIENKKLKFAQYKFKKINSIKKTYQNQYNLPKSSKLIKNIDYIYQ